MNVLPLWNIKKSKSVMVIIFMLFSIIICLATFAAGSYAQSPKDTGRDQVVSGIGSEVNLLQREYRDDVTDLYVKVPGGRIEVHRWYYQNKWQWEHDRHKLVFTYDTLEPTRLRLVASGGVEYSYGGSATFTAPLAHTERIKIEAQEFRWVDKFGNWRFFDKEGRQVSWGDRYGTICANIYDEENKKVIGLKDRNNKQRIWFEYQGDNLISARDMQDSQNPACRKVEYTYTNNLLTSVKDVMGYTTRYEYAEGRLTRKINARGFSTSIGYSSNGSVASVTDSKGIGYTFAFNYDAAKREHYAAIKSPGGMIKEVWFDQDNDTIRMDINGRPIRRVIKFANEAELPAIHIRLSTGGSGGGGGPASISAPQHAMSGGVGRHELVVDERGNTTTKFYDEWDNMTRVIYPDGSEVNYEYDLRLNLPKKETNEQGIVTEKEYDGSGNVIRLKEAVGTPLERITEYSYTSGNNLTYTRRLADANTSEATTSMSYDADGNLATLTDAENNNTRFTSYDIMGNLLTRKDSRNKEWKYTYYKNGNLETSTDPLNNMTQMFYDEVGNLVRQIDAENHETKFQYDDHNRMTKRIDALGNETLLAYNLDGKMINQTDAEGKILQYEYDNEGHMLKSIDGNNNVIELVYDVPGGSGCASCGGGDSSQPARIKYPTFTKEFVYDNMNRKTEETDILDPVNPVNPVKYVSSFNYDKSGNMIYQKDKEGKVTQYQYDVLNRLTKVINILTNGTNETNQTNETSHLYDNRDNLLSLKDAKGQITRFEYDKNNRLIKEIRPLSQALNYTYDETGNLKTRLDPKNQKTEYVYDDTGKLQTVKYYNPVDPVNPVKNVLLIFDKIGNLKSYNDGTTQGQYQYDALYRKTSETVNYGPFSKSFQYDYYKNSLKKTYTDPAGIAYTYSYDQNNLLAGIQIPDQGIITYQSYKWMTQTAIVFPGGSKREFEYDPMMRIKKITSLDPGQNVLLNYQYSYDKMDNIRTKTTEHGNYSYNYDDLYRLTNETNPTNGTNETGYSYDPVGNRLTSISGVTVNWAYNQNNELQNYDDVTFQYDANGNMIQKITDNGQPVTVDYEYDIENRLIQVKNGNGNTIAKYEYDPFGRRLWKEVDGQRTYFIYCDEGLAGELNPSGSLIKSYGYKPNSTWTTDPVFMQQEDNYYYYHNDHLGTPQKMTLSNGAVVWSAKYTAFGEAVVDPSSMISNNLRFPGQYYDEETQLHYNYHRYYEPRRGRYITADPIGLIGGLNLFLYANNPIKFYDYNGLLIICDNSLVYGNVGINLFSGEKGSGLLDCKDKCGNRNCYSYKFVCAGVGIGPDDISTQYSGMAGTEAGGWVGKNIDSFSGLSLQLGGNVAAIVGASGSVSISLSPYYPTGIGATAGTGGGLSASASLMYCWTYSLVEVQCSSYPIPPKPPGPFPIPPRKHPIPPHKHPIPPRPNKCGGFCR